MFQSPGEHLRDSNVRARLEDASVGCVQELPVHLDGARLFNAAVALRVDAKAITDLVTSVQFCLSKVSAAPASSHNHVHPLKRSSAHNRWQAREKPQQTFVLIAGISSKVWKAGGDPV